MANHRNPDREEITFEGRRYSRLPDGSSRSHARYFYCNEWDSANKRYRRTALHRDMWEAKHGPIPKGHDIHHADEDWDNNTIDNFECITKSAHHKLHGADPEFKRTMRRWHKKNGKALQAAARVAHDRPKDYTCGNCSKPFVAKSFKAKFCRDPDCLRERWVRAKRSRS